MGVREENRVPYHSLLENKVALSEKLIINEGNPQVYVLVFLSGYSCQWFTLCFNSKNHKKDYILSTSGNASQSILPILTFQA